jgi:outer membrane protein
MKKYGLVLIAVLMAYGFSAVAAAAADTGTYKFGYVDFNRALNEVEEGKRAKANLKAEFEQKQKKLEMMQKELTAMQKDLEKQRLILSAEALKKKEEVFRKKFIEVNQKLASYKEEMAKKEIEATGKILNRLRSLVRDIGSKEGYTMILEKSQDVVIYSPPGSDLTSRVIKMFNKGK